MADFGLIESFEIDDGSLDGLTPVQAFVLGVEWHMFLSRITRGERGQFIVHAINAPRIQRMGARHKRYCEWHYTAPGWAEIVLGTERRMTNDREEKEE